MNVFFEKIRQLRINKGLSVNGLCSLANITRGTLWKWENGKQVPKLINIKRLAVALNVPISEISDITEEIIPLKKDFSEVIDSWKVLSSMDKSQQQNKYYQLIKDITSLNQDISQTKIIINALLSSMNTIFYIKDSKQQYIVASEAFLKNINLDPSYNVFGKEDKDFFSNVEAKENTKQDAEVLQHGQEIKDTENYIPGSRRKRWGLISKYPVFDTNRELIAVLGIVFDITERKQAEEKREMLETLLDYVPDIIGFSLEKAKDKHLYFNKSIEKLGNCIDWYYEKGLDHVIKESMHPEDAVALKRLRFFQEKRKQFPSKHSFRLKVNGHYRWFEQINAQINYKNEWHEIGINRDISEEKQKENENEIQTNILEEFLDHEKTVFWIARIIDNELILSYISENIKSLTGYSKKDFFKTPSPCSFTIMYPENYKKENQQKPKYDLFSIIHPSDHIKIINAVKEETIPNLLQLKIVTIDGNLINIETTLSLKKSDALPNIIIYGKARKI